MNALERRRKKLIEPRIQWRFTVIFLTTAALSALTQAIVLGYLLLRTADRLPNDGLVLKSDVPSVLGTSLLVTVLLLVPVTLVVGIKATHRVVGPLYRFRVYLTELVEGAAAQPCRIRKEDELQDFCELLNRATEPLRRAPSARAQLPEREAA